MANGDLTRLWVYRGLIDDALVAFFGTAAQRFEVELSDHSRQALKHLREYTLRPGKRIRGSLAALSYDTAAGRSQAVQGLQLGVVLELLQSYLLIIDDVMDQSSLRRGKPTVHKLYESSTGEFGGAHEAEMLAINIGCLAQHLANLQLAEIDVPAEQFRQTTELLHRNIGVTGLGQLDDLHQRPGREISEAEVLEKYRHKSSYYTFVNPLQVGLALAGKADEASLKAAEAFGVPAGVAFQLHDDYLGIFGDEAKLGKQTLDDLREGKFTLLVQYALQQADDLAREELLGMLGNPAASLEDLHRMQAILAATGAQKYCLQQMKMHAEIAKKALQTAPVGDENLSQILADLVDYAVTRES